MDSHFDQKFVTVFMTFNFKDIHLHIICLQLDLWETNGFSSTISDQADTNAGPPTYFI